MCVRVTPRARGWGQAKGDPAARPSADVSPYAAAVFAAQSVHVTRVYAAAVAMFEAQYAAVFGAPE